MAACDLNGLDVGGIKTRVLEQFHFNIFWMCTHCVEHTSSLFASDLITERMGHCQVGGWRC
jgi:hypothetical protein